MLEFLRRFLNPLGPIGEWLSPTVVYKTRQGLPIQAPRAIYAQAPQTTVDLKKTVQGVERIMPADADVPYSRVRAISAFVEEHWQPILEPCKSTDLATLLQAAQHPTIIGWKVTLHARKEAQAKAPMSAEEFVEHVQSLSIPKMADEDFNVYLDMLPGNDPCIVDGEVLRGTPTFDSNGKMTHDGVIRGGTQIRGGRRDYRAKTKNAIFWDKGAWNKHIEVLNEEASRPVRNVKRALEAQKGISLPMHRPVGINPRRDRQADV
jgi:hypothetical protein